MREPVFNETMQLGIVVRDLEATGYGGTKTTTGSARGSSLRSTPVRRITTATTESRSSAPRAAPTPRLAR
jgi:hypothetical protein